jgi:curved DNA-binding protein
VKDYYHTLQVSLDAEREVIDAAYRRLARKYHPDVYTEPDAAERMRELNEAYEVLGDPRKRAEYDRARHQAR